MLISRRILNLSVESKFSLIKRYKQRHFEHLKQLFEVKPKLLDECFIVVQCDGLSFKQFTKLHEFHKPTDQRNVNLTSFCAREIFDQYRAEVLCALGFSDEVNFAFRSSTKLYDRNYK
jgi:tRNA(His) 5'-end guanylyltransferase